MAARIEAARLLTYKAAVLKDEKKPYSVFAAAAKLMTSETSTWVCNRALDIVREKGCQNSPIERLFRDARITEIYEGTSEIQRVVIAATILGK
ncbi:acyl-CoA dehydrogenase family protein [Candidatus Riflebacteria bacterium]